MKLYTKTGDQGQTGLIGGGRVGKDHPRIEAYGSVDEVNAALGFALLAIVEDDLKKCLRTVQDRLFILGAELADPAAGAATPSISEADIEQLEKWIDEATEAVPPLRQFILPGGTEAAARLHLARTICRRAERAVVGLAQLERVGDRCTIYLNRLGDLLFAWARLANSRAGVADIPWQPTKS